MAALTRAAGFADSNAGIHLPAATRTAARNSNSSGRSGDAASASVVVPLPLPAALQPPLLDTPQASVKRVKTVADFELLKVLGRGAYGKVFLVRRVPTAATIAAHSARARANDVLAMKVMRKKELIERNVVDNVRIERNVLSGLDHPYIVRMRYAFQTEHKLYLLMNYVPGGELFTLLEREGAFTERQARFYAAQVVLALEYLHERNILYRDLKPENILLIDQWNDISIKVLCMMTCRMSICTL